MVLVIVGATDRISCFLFFFTERSRIVRIFSARPATRQEQNDYEEGIDIRS